MMRSTRSSKPWRGRWTGAASFDGDRRGYVRCRLDRRQWWTDLRMVTTVSRSDAPVYTFASFEVEDGTPGAVRV